MNVSAVESITTYTPREPRATTFTSQEFMTLLIAQLQHQDPLDPMDSQDFMAQLAQLQSVATLNELYETVDDYARKAGLLVPVSLVGRTVKWQADDGSIREETVEAVRISGDKPMIVAAGELLDITQITEIW